jgi:2-polyprenyl-6-methoxyphenol hydroxylase-like FAD-dependent oxidoreductase
MPRTHVVICGAGPAGLLLAHGLLEPHCERYRIDILERGGRADAFAADATWALPLGVRGRAALQSCDSGQLWAAVAPVRVPRNPCTSACDALSCPASQSLDARACTRLRCRSCARR